MKVYARSTVVPCSDTDAFDVIERIGGNTGYYYGDWLWRARARIDRLLGGPGLLPGRRDPDHLVVGDEVNCWEVAEYEPNSLLSLATRMKMPGDGWLQFEVEDLGGDTRIHLTVRFRPRGLPGQLYWYTLYPIHLVIWSGMLRAIARHAAARTLRRERPGANVLGVLHVYDVMLNPAGPDRLLHLLLPRAQHRPLPGLDLDEDDVAQGSFRQTVEDDEVDGRADEASIVRVVVEIG